MSLLRNFRKILVNAQANVRPIFFAHSHLQQQKSLLDQFVDEEKEWIEEDPKDRSIQIDVETSIKYMNSEAFKETYGDNLIWTLYVRNKTHHFVSETRKRCIRQGHIQTGSPCPVCRDMYLVLDYRNTQLLQHFISPESNQILPSKKTGLCQMQQRNLVVAVLKAKEYGTLPFYVPHRHYDYEYYKKLSRKSVEESKSGESS